MQRLLIAIGSEVLCQLVHNAFQEEFEIESCRSGERALELLNSFLPDALILDFNLPYKDGLTVLQEAAHRPTAILALTNGINTYVTKACAETGVGFLLTNPTVNAICVRLLDLVHNGSGKAPDPEEQTVQHLHALGFRSGMDGYKQLVAGIPIYSGDQTQPLEKELYPAIAARLDGKSTQTIEHSIRNAIQTAWKFRDDAVWAKYFSPGTNGQIPCPNNKDFIARIAQMLRK